MRRDYVPIPALEGGEYIRLTGPGWHTSPPGGPAWGSVVRVEWVETLDNGDHVAAFEHTNPITGEARYWFVDDNIYHAAFVAAN